METTAIAAAPSSSSAALELVQTPSAAELVAFDFARAEEQARRNPAAVYLAKKTPATRQVMATCLDTIAAALSAGRCTRDTLPWPTVRYPHAVALREWLAGEYEPSTVNVHLTAFRGVMRECRLLHLIDAEDYEPMAEIKNIDHDDLAAGDPLNPGEIRAIFATCDDSPKGIRDRAALALLRQTGARVSAIVGLDLEDYTPLNGDLHLRHGKRQRQQRDRLSGGAKEALDAWIALRGHGTAADGARPLLCRVDRAGRVIVARLSRKALWAINVERSKLAGIRPRCNHDWRHTVATELDANKVSIRLIQEKLGHAQLSTTQRYVHVDADALRAASETLTVPSRRPIR
jgi:integrase